MTDLEEAKRHIRALTEYIDGLHFGHNECVVCRIWSGHADDCEFGNAKAFLSRLDGEGQTVEGGDLAAVLGHLKAVADSLGISPYDSRPIACYVDDLTAELTRLRAEQCDRNTVLEEAAKVADDRNLGRGPGLMNAGKRAEAITIAHFIRALKDQTEGSGA